ncbi:MAG TPA: GNAT family N-acetyltransferase [Terriglobales bacterium]|nr:GNAT family N-acetyltransferase [Terriglobales bacterium]
MGQIRECRDTDFDQVFLLLKQLWPSKELDRIALSTVYARAIRGDAQHYICAIEDDRVVGFCSLTLTNNLWQAGYLAHIDELVVDEQQRGRGIGRALLNAIVEVAVKAGCPRIELDSAFHRKDAHKFYEAQGFENRAHLFSKVLLQEPGIAAAG